MILHVLFRLEKKDIIRIFISGDGQFGSKQIIQTQVFDRNTVVIMNHSALFHQVKPGQPRRGKMKLYDSSGGLKSLHKTIASLEIKRFQFNVEFIRQCEVDPGEILQITRRHKQIPIQGESGHSLLKHGLSADDNISDGCIIEFFQERFH